MSHEQPATDETPAPDTAVHVPDTALRANEDTSGYEPIEDRQGWPLEGELPRRPRRRLLTPIPLALLGVLLIACGFIGGVLLEKGQGSPSASSSSNALASRFAALRSGAVGGGAGISSSATGGGGGGGLATTGAASAAGATIGQVAYVSGSTLYVTDPEGNTVKVRTSAASTVTKTVRAEVKSIHPGETVIVTGGAGSNGAIRAESIRVSETGGGGLGALFGGGGLSGAGRGSGGRAGSAGGGNAAGSSEGPVLFGK